MNNVSSDLTVKPIQITIGKYIFVRLLFNTDLIFQSYAYNLTDIFSS